MKRAACLVLLVAACRTSVPSAPNFGPGTDALVAVERELNEAFMQRDARRIDALLAPEYAFHYIDYRMRGSLQATPTAPRGRWIAPFFDKVTGGPLMTSIVDVRRYGDLGVVTTYYDWQGSFMNTPFQYSGHVTDVWIRRGRKWQLLASSTNLSSGNR